MNSKLNPATYWSNETWELERTGLFSRCWTAIARLDRLDEVGAYVTADIVGEPVVVVRTVDGLRAYSNVCRHRSSTLLEGTGTVKAIRCPYHLWTYNLDGRLTGAPCMTDVDGFDKETITLVALPIETWQGWVFVNPDPTASPLVESLTHLDELMTQTDLSTYRTVETLSYQSPWNWKVQVDNFSESYHHAGIHPATLQTAFPGQKSWGEDNHGEPWFYLNHTSVIPGVEPFVAAGVFPTTMFSISPPHAAMWFEIRPTSAQTCDLDIHLLADDDAHPDELTFLADTLRDINAEDIAINARTQTGLRSRHAAAPILSDLELCTAQFHQWVTNQLWSRSSEPSTGASS